LTFVTEMHCAEIMTNVQAHCSEYETVDFKSSDNLEHLSDL